MVKRTYSLILILLLAFTACTANEKATPTPFPQAGNPLPNVSLGQIVPVELTYLTTNPETYEGMMVMVNGRYKRRPPIVCSTTLYRSPATWNLVSGETNAFMNGFDGQLRSLLPEEISMTISGIWRQWNGPVGCGKTSSVQKIWYLEVHEIISPNPIARVTLTPTLPDNGEEIADIGQPEPIEGIEETPPTDDGLSTAPAPGQSETTTPLVGTPTPFITNNTSLTTTPTPPSSGDENEPPGDGEGDENETPIATATTDNSGNNTPAPTATPSNNNNPITTPYPSSPTATIEPNIINVGELSTFQLGYELLNTNETHVWDLDLTANDVITISVAAQSSIDVVLSLKDPSGKTVITAQNNAPAGEVEHIYKVTVTATGIYELLIKTRSGAGGEYVANIYTDSSFPFLFKGILEYDEMVTATLSIEADDYWHFYGNKGDSVVITVEPAGNADFFVTLWAESGDLAESDEPDLGAIETITFVLPDNGMYSIQVADWDLLNQGYEISLERN
jgi:hypothetical protein